jgi:hypothetical protein
LWFSDERNNNKWKPDDIANLVSDMQAMEKCLEWHLIRPKRYSFYAVLLIKVFVCDTKKRVLKKSSAACFLDATVSLHYRGSIQKRHLQSIQTPG